MTAGTQLDELTGFIREEFFWRNELATHKSIGRWAEAFNPYLAILESHLQMALYDPLTCQREFRFFRRAQNKLVTGQVMILTFFLAMQPKDSVTFWKDPNSPDMICDSHSNS